VGQREKGYPGPKGRERTFSRNWVCLGARKTVREEMLDAYDSAKVAALYTRKNSWEKVLKNGEHFGNSINEDGLGCDDIKGRAPKKNRS